MIIKPNNSSKARLVFRRAQLSYLLRSFRQLHNMAREDTVKRLRKYLNRKGYEGDPAWENLRGMIDCDKNLIKLEFPGKAHETFQLPSIKPLAYAYNIGGLMFESLLSEPVNEDYLAYNCSNPDDFLDVGGDYGKDKIYRIPKRVLRGSDNIKIIYQKLDPCVESITHAHSGEELLFLENGSIEFLLKDLGFRAKLDGGRYIHFDASQLHKACNYPDKPAEMLIFRFLRFRSRTRTDIFRKMKSLKSSGEIMQKMIKEMIEPQWIYTKKKTGKKEVVKDEIRDRYGLARFLDLLCSKPFVKTRPTFDKLLERAKGSTFNRSKLVRLHHGTASITKEELLMLGKIYKTQPMLFYNFLFPAFLYTIAVDLQRDMRTIPITLSKLKDGVYKVPCRRLAYSDISIATVELNPNSSTPDNKHPGYELLKPLEGQIAITLDDEKYPPIQQGEFAYFRSHLSHSVFNEGKKSARILVVRFLE